MQNLNKLFLSIFLSSFFLLSCAENSNLKSTSTSTPTPTVVSKEDEIFKNKMPNFYYLPDKIKYMFNDLPEADKKKLDKKVPFTSGDTIPYYEFSETNVRIPPNYSETGDITGIRFSFYIEFPYKQDYQNFGRGGFWITSYEDTYNNQTMPSPYNGGLSMTELPNLCDVGYTNSSLDRIVYNCILAVKKGEQIKMPKPLSALNFKDEITKHTLFLSYQEYIGENGKKLPNPVIKFKLAPAQN